MRLITSGKKQRPFPTVLSLGVEGAFGKTVFTYWSDVDSERVVRFEGDQTLRQVVDSLTGWGIVSSRLWPHVRNRFPQLAACETYLEELGSLWPKGTHPLHQSEQTTNHTFGNFRELNPNGNAAIRKKSKEQNSIGKAIRGAFIGMGIVGEEA